MQVLRVGSIGTEVSQWQTFLLGQGHYEGVVDGHFGPVTEKSTKLFQRASGCRPDDGVVGRKTYAKAMERGYGNVYDDDNKHGPGWPPRPDDLMPSSAARREKMFGKFKYKHVPTPRNRENIEMLDNWAKENIIRVHIPQLENVDNKPRDCNVWFHKKAAKQLQNLWAAWEEAGLLHLVLTWNGSYVPRLVRGSNKTLSSHSHGSAFDINAQWNRIGAEPALVGREGSVRELVPLAKEHGFWFGGWFRGRPDGMHFEVSKIM